MYRNGKRIFIILTAALLALVASVAGALGLEEAGQERIFSIKGTVESANPATGTITVDVASASRLLEKDQGKSVTFKVANNAKVQQCEMGVTANHTISCRGTDHGGMDSNIGRRSGHDRDRGDLDGRSSALNDIRKGELIHLVGYFDAKANQYVVTHVMVPADQNE